MRSTFKLNNLYTYIYIYIYNVILKRFRETIIVVEKQ